MPRNQLSRSVIILACLLSPLSIALGDAPMNVFSSAEGRFSVYMEGKPITKSVNLNGRSPVKCFAHDEKDGGYWITWTDVPIANDGPTDTVNRALNGACSGAVAGMNATESARYSVNLQGGYPGRQVEGALPNSQGFFRMRIFLVGNRLYQLVAVGSKPYLKGNSPNKFLSSLSIAPQTASSTATTNLPRSQRSSNDMDRQRADMQARSNALKQRVQEQQDKVRKDLEAARAHRASGW